jgi:hypothetical protein
MDRIEQESSEDSAERRRAPRRRVLRRVQIVTLDKRSTIDCTVKNLSSCGALISAQLGRDIPDKFYLRSPGQLRFVLCQVVRRNLTSVAVIFEEHSDKLADCLGIPADLIPPSPSRAV